jgi:hypothetical protein
LAITGSIAGVHQKQLKSPKKQTLPGPAVWIVNRLVTKRMQRAGEIERSADPFGSIAIGNTTTGGIGSGLLEQNPIRLKRILPS